MRWNQGREVIVDMLRDRTLDKVIPSREHSDELLAKPAPMSKPRGAKPRATQSGHISSSTTARGRRLRPSWRTRVFATSRGGHIAVLDASRAQLDPPMGDIIRRFGAMRRRRNDVEYPDVATKPVDAEEVNAAIPHAEAIIDLADRVLDQMSPF